MTARDRNEKLQERLIDLAVRVVRLTAALPTSRTGNHVGGQLVRSGTAPAPNYAEAMDAESRADFVHKAKIVLKELRETHVWLRIIEKSELLKPASRIRPLLTECNELISIFVASVRTAKTNAK
jgi:four helix bundle protein